jgi:hypothetical protein
VKFAREVIVLAATGKVQQKNLMHLIGMERSQFSSHVGKVMHGRSEYQGPKSGKPLYLVNKDKVEYMEENMNKRVTRDSTKIETKDAVIKAKVASSLTSRGRAVPACVSNPDKQISRGWTKSLEKETGIKGRVCQRDNSARTRAIESPRNAIYNYAGLLSLCDSEYTFDGKDIHPRLRGNIDGLTVYTKNEGEKCVTACAKSPLLEANPQLLPLFKLSQSFPATVQGDDQLAAVTLT